MISGLMLIMAQCGIPLLMISKQAIQNHMKMIESSLVLYTVSLDVVLQLQKSPWG